MGGVGASLPLLQVFVYNLKTTTTELIDREEFFRVFDQIQYSRRFKYFFLLLPPPDPLLKVSS